MSLENLEPTHERKDKEFALPRPPSFAQYSNLPVVTAFLSPVNKEKMKGAESCL